ncbi:outer membrane beta-barrel protein [Flavobacterium piscinae]|uniref:PorT family protein n=1 Tax=Flavobacterium piscinae TaxID=2506424 RepID=A0A4Q1KNF8_9FLAO|nr:outer membrane beta-barrel protein [Flavobacterium piscinae]MBC8883390.1 outer membrane beta-barrel protein [Flavobacterium piscinae]RXR31573.1 PorT family protein [Flavobacterium piscinae]
MKRIVFAFLFFFGLTFVNAQVTFKPGLRAGLNLSKITQSDASTRSDFYIAGFGELKLTKYYTLQPEISYSKQGGNDVLVQNFNNQTGNYDVSKEDISVDYISFAIVNKFTFNNKFNIHIGPTIDFQAGQNQFTQSDVDLAFLLGLGISVTNNLSIEARVKKGIIDIYETDYFSDNSYNVGDYNTNFLFQLGVSYTFDLK